MSKVCPKCGREFGNSSQKCPICNCGLEELGIKKNKNLNTVRNTAGEREDEEGIQKKNMIQTSGRAENNRQYNNIDENGVLKMKGNSIGVVIGIFTLVMIAVSTLSFYVISIVVVTVLLTVLLTNSQKEDIRNTTYYEKIMYEGREKVIQKIKCPTCGNKLLGYQRVNDSAFTMVHGKRGRFSTTSISSSQYAICNNCGTDFRVIRRTTPFINFIVSFIASLVICSIGNLIWVFVTI